MATKLFKNKYLIGIYAPECEGETLLGLCDNAKEFSEFMGITYKNAHDILTKLFLGIRHYIRFCGKICKVEFIDIEE